MKETYKKTYLRAPMMTDVIGAHFGSFAVRGMVLRGVVVGVGVVLTERWWW
jgi:hypothetical protein